MRLLVVLLFFVLAGCAEPAVRSGDGIAPRDETITAMNACDARPTPSNRATLTDLVTTYSESPDLHMMRGMCEMTAANAPSADRAEALSIARASFDRAIALVDAGRPSSSSLPNLVTLRYIVRSIQEIESGTPYWAPVLEDMDRAIVLEPTSQRHADRAVTYAQLGEAGKMIADLDRAEPLAGSDSTALAHLDAVRQTDGVRERLAAARP